MEFTDVVEGRRSVRDFSPEPVPRDVLTRIVHAAQLAPSSFNMQPWHFHVVTGEARSALGGIVSQATVHLSEYMDMLGPKRYEDAKVWYSSLGNAPIVIGVSMPADGMGLEATNKLLSVGSAVENLLLAATAEGVGSCMVTFAWWVRDELASLFGLAPGREVVAVIALGYPSHVLPASPPKRTDNVDWLD